MKTMNKENCHGDMIKEDRANLIERIRRYHYSKMHNKTQKRKDSAKELNNLLKDLKSDIEKYRLNKALNEFKNNP